MMNLLPDPVRQRRVGLISLRRFNLSRFVRGPLAIVLLLLLTTPAEAGMFAKFKDMYKAKFKQQYAVKFVESCTRGSREEAVRQICECCAEEALTRLSVRQLHNTKKTSEYIQTNILPECEDRYIKSIRESRV